MKKTLQKSPIIYFSGVRWEDILQRPQQLVKIWARERIVIYISPERALIQRFNHFIKKPQSFFRRAIQIEKNVFVLNLPFYLPKRHQYLWISKFNGLYTSLVLKSFLKKQGIKNYLVGVADIFSAFTLSYLHPLCIFYDCVDNWEEYPIFHNKRLVTLLEKKVIQSSNFIITTSYYLKTKIQQLTNKEIFLVNNGVSDVFLTHQKISPSNLLGFKKPIIGYFGAIGMWLDLTLLEFCLQRDPSSYVLIGPLITQSPLFRQKFFSLLRLYKNLHWLGAKKHEVLPQFISQLDAIIIPFKQNKLIKGVDPIKIYEALALGKPVVSTYWQELEKFKPLISLVQTPQEFLYKIKEEIRLNNMKKVKARRCFAKKNRWEEKANEIIKIVCNYLNKNETKI